MARKRLQEKKNHERQQMINKNDCVVSRHKHICLSCFETLLFDDILKQNTISFLFIFFLYIFNHNINLFFFKEMKSYKIINFFLAKNQSFL